MEQLNSYRRRLLAVYAGQAGELKSIAGALDEAAPRPEGGWSAHQIIVHLRDVEQQAYAPRLHRILREADPQLPGFDPQAWMDEHYDPLEPLTAVLDHFEMERRSSAAHLPPIESPAWSRSGHHPDLGRRTLQWWVERSIAHAAEHLPALVGSRREG